MIKLITLVLLTLLVGCGKLIPDKIETDNKVDTTADVNVEGEVEGTLNGEVSGEVQVVADAPVNVEHTVKFEPNVDLFRSICENEYEDIKGTDSFEVAVEDCSTDRFARFIEDFMDNTEQGE